MPACGYEFCLLVFNSISHSFAALTRRVEHSKIKFTSQPCIRLAGGKFELTNQDLAGGKNSSVLTSR